MLLCRLQSTSLSFTYFIKARYMMKYHCRLNNVYQLLYTTFPYLIIWRKDERKKVNPNILHFFPNLIQLLRSLQIYPFFTTRRSPPSYCASPPLVAIFFGKKTNCYENTQNKQALQQDNRIFWITLLTQL